MIQPVFIIGCYCDQQFYYTTHYMLTQLTLLLLLCGCSLAQTLTCASGMSPADLIQTGSITAIAPSLTDGNRVHSFLIPINVYQLPPTGFQITTSLSQYLFAQNKTQSGYDFEVVGFPIQGGPSAQIILFINNDVSWTKIIIAYIITSRNDLFLGTFAVLGYQFSSSSNSSYIYNQSLPNWVNPAAPVGSVAQFAGFRTSAPQIQLLKINSASIDAINGIISVNITANLTAPLELIVFSYVWWVQSPKIKFSAFAPQAGTTAAYQFIGLGSISSQGLAYNGIAFAGSGIVGSIACVGLNCPSGCISISDCIGANGIIANSTCFLCASTQIYQNYSCQQAVTCGQNMKALGLNCVCQDGYFYVNSSYCVKCQANAYWGGSNCVCNFGYYAANDSSCVVCPSGSAYNQLTQKCDCPTNFIWFNGSCITCPANQLWDSSKQSCSCVSGYVLSNFNTTCVLACPGNATSTSTGCVCNAGFMNLSNKCVPCPPQSAYVQALQGCVCINGLYMSNGTCLACGTNQKYDATQKLCVCSDGYYNISGSCSQCPNNSIWNGSVCQCVNNYKMYNNTCVLCGTNQFYNGVACVCIDTFSRFGGVCSCPLNSQLIQGACVCNTNFTLNNGVCVQNVIVTIPQCPEKAAWDGTQCVCIPGLNLLNGSCQSCPANSQYDPTSLKCFCKPGYYGDSSNCLKCHFNCKTCWLGAADGCITCNKGYKLQGSTCVQNQK